MTTFIIGTVPIPDVMRENKQVAFWLLDAFLLVSSRKVFIF